MAEAAQYRLRRLSSATDLVLLAHRRDRTDVADPILLAQQHRNRAAREDTMRQNDLDLVEVPQIRAHGPRTAPGLYAAKPDFRLIHRQTQTLRGLAGHHGRIDGAESCAPKTMI